MSQIDTLYSMSKSITNLYSLTPGNKRNKANVEQCIISVNNSRAVLINQGDIVNKVLLEKIIKRLEDEINTGIWKSSSYSNLDLKMMPALVNQANCQFPEMNAIFVPTPNDLPLAIENAREYGLSARFILNMGRDGVHFGVIDCNFLNEKTSLILFEPTNYHDCMCAGMLEVRTRNALKKKNRSDYHLSVVEMDIQKSGSECGIFSLALAKKLYRESDRLVSIHKENLIRNFTLTPAEADKYLPSTFYKHTQIIKRIDAFVTLNPDAKNEIINKKGETIYTRQKNIRLK